jgi:hypothetical protein
MCKWLRRIGLWRGMAFGVALLALWDGTGYFARGNLIAHGPSLAFLRTFPLGGMKLHGAVMILLAIAIIYVIRDKGTPARIVMLVVFCYSVAFSCALVWGWHISHEVTWSAPSKWFFVAWVAVWLAATADHSNIQSRH